MSDLSELSWHAGWMSGLEYALWHVVLTGPSRFGQIDISEEQLERLRTLSEHCGGWIVFDDVHEETWVPMQRWKALYAASRSAR